MPGPEAGSAKAAKSDTTFSSSPYRFHLRLASSIDNPHSSARYRMPDVNFSLSAQSTSAPARAADGPAGVKAIPQEYKGRQIIMSMQGYARDAYPLDFAQDHKSLSYPMSTEADQHMCHAGADVFHCDDHIIPDYVSAFDAPTFYEGSWDGQCIAQRPEYAQYNKCKIFVRIIGVDIEQHVTGEGCPSEILGRKVGHVKVLKRDEMIPLLTADQQSVLLFSQIVVKWVHGASSYEKSKWIRASITTGNGKERSADDILKIIWAEPGEAWPPGYSFLDSTLPRCALSHYRQVTEAEHRLQPFQGASETMMQLGTLRRRIEREVKSVAACNASMALLYEVGTKSAQCRELVETLFSRDPLEMLPPSFSGSLCTSDCKVDLDSALDVSLEVCSAGWRQDWTMKSYRALIFKQLLTLAAMRYWMTLDCATNRHRTSCLSAASMPPFLADTACESFARRRLPPVLPFINMKCSVACQTALDEFVKDYHCCVSTVEDADQTYFGILFHPGITTIEADLRDHSDPFDLNTGQNTSLYSLVANPRSNMSGRVASNNSVYQSDNKCPASRVSGRCATLHFCASSNWEPSCCDEQACVNGYKPYPGACRCVCPGGFSGRYARLYASMILRRLHPQDMRGFVDRIKLVFVSISGMRDACSCYR